MISSPPDKIAALTIRRVALDELKPHPRNPRLHAEVGSPKWEALEKSLSFDYFDPRVWNERNGMLVSGHFRKKVLQHLGYAAADVSVVDYDEATHIARLIAANELLGDWEKELLAKLASELVTSGIGAGLAGLTEKDLAQFSEGPEVQDDTERAAKLVNQAGELAAKWKVELGDMFQIGAHRLLCGDCRDWSNWNRLLVDRFADMVWTDPPYNVDYQGAAGGMANDKMSDDAYHLLLRAAFDAAFAFTKPGGSIYVAHADSEGRTVRSAFWTAGWYESQCLIWVKHAFTLGRQDYQWQHEPILYGWKPGAGHYWQGGFSQSTVIDEDPLKLSKLSKAELVGIIQSLRNQHDATVIREPKPTANELHPTIKPLPLVARQIFNSSREGDTVLELCGGSGTTLLAAEQTRRRCVATELDPKFCAVILERATLAGLSVEKIHDAS